MYALIYNNILSCMLEPLPDHQEIPGYAPATCLAYNIVNLTLKLNFEKLKPTIF